ncbi:MAG: response regulator [Anaeromyxobacteraceae bacterium]
MRARILVVDDKPRIRELVATVLEEHDVATASDGAEALALVGGERFELVLTDVCMPGPNGYEVLRAVKAASPDTAVVLMTAFAAIPDAVAATKQGAFDYIEKPFDPGALAALVTRALEHARHAAGSGDGPAVRESAAGELRLTLPYQHAVEAAREQASRDYLVALLREFGGNVTRCAARAGMERESLHRLLRRHGIRSEDFKHAG